MKIKSGYVLRQVADSGVIVSLDEIDCNQLMTLNQSGIDLWNLLQQEQDIESLVAEMLRIYDVEERQLRADIEIFLSKIKEAGLLDE